MVATGAIGILPPIQFGRQKIEDEIKTAATQKLAQFGIEVLDFRIKRVNYNPDVLARIYQRMISERLQIAQRFRSEGEGESARIAGQRERDLNQIQSNAYRQVQQIRGEADAKATEIYARAYNQIRRRRNSILFSRRSRPITRFSRRLYPGPLDRQRPFLAGKTRCEVQQLSAADGTGRQAGTLRAVAA